MPTDSEPTLLSSAAAPAAAASNTAAPSGTSATPSQPAFVPTYEGILRPDGTFAEGWTSRALGPQYNGPLATVKSVADMDKLVRDNIAAARQKVAPPDERSSPEQIAAWRKLVGAPEQADGYGEIRPETIPPDMWDGESERALLDVAHRHHLSPTAVKEIVGLYGAQIDQQMRQMQSDAEHALASERARLQQAWGERYEDNLRTAHRFAATLGLSADHPIFTSADVVMAMARGTQLISEDRLVSGHSVGITGLAGDRATSIMTNPEDPLYAQYQSGDRETVALVNNLLQQG